MMNNRIYRSPFTVHSSPFLSYFPECDLAIEIHQHQRRRDECDDQPDFARHAGK